jgi:hypothetical protein
MTVRAPVFPPALDVPPRRVETDARAAFREVRTGRLLRLVNRFETAFSPTVALDADEVQDDVLMFKDDDIVVFLWSRRVPGGTRVVAEVFGDGAVTIAGIRRSANGVATLISRLGDRYESDTIPTGPACLVIDRRSAAVETSWHSEWLTL